MSAPEGDRAGRKADAALLRYRIMAYVTGTGLIILVCVGVPLHYAANQPLVSAIFGPAHGIFYILYLLTVLDLATRMRWHIVRILLTGAAGTIPFVSFICERYTTRYVREVRSRNRATSGTATRTG